MQTLLYSIKNYLYRLNQAKRRTYLDKQRRRIKYFLRDKLKEKIGKIRALIVWGGVWLIAHSPFLKKEIKILFKDFKDYYALKQTLVSNLHSTYFIENFNTIKVWLYSKEFKENYQDKNHPYPSLLNSEKIDYENIPAELAWEMNVPLPRRYGSILLLFGLSGHTALGTFLYRITDSRVFCGRAELQTYINVLNTLNQKNTDMFHFSNFLINLEDRQRFLSLCDAKVPVLILVRDPISRLKHGVNHGDYKMKDYEKAYDIKEKTELMVDRIHYSTICGTKDKSNLNCLDFAFQAKGVGNLRTWQYDSTIKEIPNPKFIYYKEIQIIVAELIKAKDKIDILPQMSLNTLGLKIGFFLEEEQVKKLFNDMHLLEFVKEKMQKYLYALKDKATSVEKNKVKEEDILAYLRANPKLARIYKSYFDSEFTHIKTHRPDIVASWKYYQEFERMCEEGG